MSEIESGSEHEIQETVWLDGEVAFSEGEMVTIDREEDPDPDNPEKGYVAYSSALRRYIRLSPGDLRITQERDPKEVCLHTFKSAQDSQFVCSKCGLNIAQGGFSFCSICGQELNYRSIICGKCGAPNEKLIKQLAPPVDSTEFKRCIHDYRYIENGMICVRCGKTIPLKTVAARRKYAHALGKKICTYCGVNQVEENVYCDKCGKEYEDIPGKQQAELIFNPKQIRVLPPRRPVRETVQAGLVIEGASRTSQESSPDLGVASEAYSLQVKETGTAKSYMNATGIVEIVVGSIISVFDIIFITTLSSMTWEYGTQPAPAWAYLLLTLVLAFATLLIIAGVYAIRTTRIEPFWIHIVLGSITVFIGVVSLALTVPKTPVIVVLLEVLLYIIGGVVIIAMALVSSNKIKVASDIFRG